MNKNYEEILEKYHAAYNAKEYTLALTYAQKLVDVEDKNPVSYFYRGTAYNALKQYQKAIADYSIAIQLDNKLTQAYYNRGNAYSYLKQYQKAIADYSIAIQLDNKDAAAYHNRGVAYADLKQYQKAIDDYDIAIQLDNKDAAAYHNRGIAYADLKQYQKAIADYSIAIQLDNKLTQAYHNRGIAYADLKQYQKAIQDWQKLFQLGAESINQRLSSFLNIFFQTLSVPLFAQKVIQTYLPPNHYWVYDTLLAEIRRQCQVANTCFAYWEATQGQQKHVVAYHQRAILLTYYLSDPVQSYELTQATAYQQAKPNDLFRYYYGILSAIDFHEPYQNLQKEALKIAYQVKEQIEQKNQPKPVIKPKKKGLFGRIKQWWSGKSSEEKGTPLQEIPQEKVEPLQIYYAGQIFCLFGQYDNALSCFQDIKEDFLPACYMEITCLERQLHTQRENYKKAFMNIHELIKQLILKEENLQGSVGFLRKVSIQKIEINLAQQENIKPFLYYAHYREIETSIKYIYDVYIKKFSLQYEDKWKSWLHPCFQSISAHDVWKLSEESKTLVKEYHWTQKAIENLENQLQGTTSYQQTQPIAQHDLQLEQKIAQLVTTWAEQSAKETKQEAKHFHQLVGYYYLTQKLDLSTKIVLDLFIVVKKHELNKGWIIKGTNKDSIKDGIKELIGNTSKTVTGVITGIFIGTFNISGIIISILTGVLFAVFNEKIAAEITNFLEEYLTSQEKPAIYKDFKQEALDNIDGLAEKLGTVYYTKHPIVASLEWGE